MIWGCFYCEGQPIAYFSFTLSGPCKRSWTRAYLDWPKHRGSDKIETLLEQIMILNWIFPQFSEKHISWDHWTDCPRLQHWSLFMGRTKHFGDTPSYGNLNGKWQNAGDFEVSYSQRNRYRYVSSIWKQSWLKVRIAWSTLELFDRTSASEKRISQTPQRFASNGPPTH